MNQCETNTAWVYIKIGLLTVKGILISALYQYYKFFFQIKTFFFFYLSFYGERFFYSNSTEVKTANAALGDEKLMWYAYSTKYLRQ